MSQKFLVEVTIGDGVPGGGDEETLSFELADRHDLKKFDKAVRDLLGETADLLNPNIPVPGGPRLQVDWKTSVIGGTPDQFVGGHVSYPCGSEEGLTLARQVMLDKLAKLETAHPAREKKLRKANERGPNHGKGRGK